MSEPTDGTVAAAQVVGLLGLIVFVGLAAALLLVQLDHWTQMRATNRLTQLRAERRAQLARARLSLGLPLPVDDSLEYFRADDVLAALDAELDALAAEPPS